MNPIESGTTSTAGYDSAGTTTGSVGAAPATTTGVTTSSSSTTSGVGASASTNSASPVTPELQAVKHSTQTTVAAANNDHFSLMSRVVETLVSVVTTLVTLMTNLMSQFKGVTANGASSGAVGTSTTTPGGSTTGAAGTTQTPGTATALNGTIVRSALDVNRNDAGMITVRTLDGYSVRAEGRDEAWMITGPDGKTTRIWGDPHVTESDGDKWDFLRRSTFMFGKNKATVEVVPAGNGQTLSARLTVYSDRERVTIDGIEKNRPSIVAASSDGLEHDASLADGDIYKRVVTATGESWISTTTGKPVPVKR